MKPWTPTEEEKRAIAAAIEAARQVQTFLWGEANGAWGLEEWLRMFRKRVAKLEEVRRDNPHAAVELKKRLLQTTALSVALVGIIDRDGVPWEAVPGAPASNLPGFSEPLGTASLSFEIFEHEKKVGSVLLKPDWTEDQVLSEIEAMFDWVTGGTVFIRGWPSIVTFHMVFVMGDSVATRQLIFKVSSPTSNKDTSESSSIVDCECWEAVNDREGMQPCEHERLPKGCGPFSNSREPGICRCGAEGPPWKHRFGCAYD